MIGPEAWYRYTVHASAAWIEFADTEKRPGSLEPRRSPPL